MLYEIYNYLLLAIAYSCCIFGLCFLFLQIPKNNSLQGYRIMRKAIAVAYVILGILHFIEFSIEDESTDKYLPMLTTLVVASFQACLFTYALITLIDIQFTSKKKLWVEIAIIFSLSIVSTLFYALKNELFFFIAFYSFIAYYFIQLARYTYLFRKYFKKYRNEMDNYFSDKESNRMRWVIFAFFSALGIGILAFMILFTPLWTVVVVQVVIVIYYFFFGVQFINYAFRFQYIEKAISPVAELEVSKEETSSISYSALSLAIDAWVDEMKFIEPGITIDQMAACLCTNRTYLSTFINTEKQMNFKTWINYLRIEEAKKLILENPTLPLGEITLKVGYNEQSSFGKQFMKFEETTPLAWRKQYLSQTGNN